MLTLFHKTAPAISRPQLRTLLAATLFAAPLLMPTPLVRDAVAQENAPFVATTTIKRTHVEPNGATTSTSSTFSTTQNYDGLLIVVRQQFKDKDNTTESYEAIEPAASLLHSLAKTPEQKSVSLALLAETLHRRQLYAESRDKWNELLALPKSGDEDTDQVNQLMGHLGLVESYLAQKDYAQVIAQYQAINDYIGTINFKADFIKDYTPQQAMSMFMAAQADAYYKMGQYEMARQQSDKAVTLSEGNAVFLALALFQSGEINLAQHNYAASKARFNQMLGLSGAGKDKEDKDFAPTIATIAKARLAQIENLTAPKAGGGKASNALEGKSKLGEDNKDYVSTLGDSIENFPSEMVNSFILDEDDD